MACSRPLTIPRPASVNQVYAAIRGVDVYSRDYVTVPCGRCMDCLKHRQSDLAMRIAAEAEKRGSMVFTTLTYDDEHLPLTSSLFCCDTETGELEQLTLPEFIACSRRVDEQLLREQFVSIIPTAIPRYLDFDIPQFSVFEPHLRFFYRVTPSVCREDVRLWLKRARISYLRDHGCPLPKFSYVMVPEYGPRTCRPHYHLVFMGLSFQDVEYLTSSWNFGFVKNKVVSRSNKDGSDGFAAAARYVGKYMSKGVFECESVKECVAQKPRLCSSKNLGDNYIPRLKPYCLAFDLFGEYDPDTLLLARGGFLSRQQIDTLIQEIPKRLSFSFDGKHYFALPRYFRKHIFYHVEERFEYNQKSHTVSTPKFYRPSRLWQMVSDSIRSEFESIHSREFSEFFRQNASRSPDEVCAAFTHIQECSAQTKESIERENFKQFLAKSVF